MLRLGTGQICSKTFLPKDTFDLRDISAQSHFCTKGHFCTEGYFCMRVEISKKIIKIVTDRRQRLGVTVIIKIKNK